MDSGGRLAGRRPAPRPAGRLGGRGASRRNVVCAGGGGGGGLCVRSDAPADVLKIFCIFLRFFAHLCMYSLEFCASFLHVTAMFVYSLHIIAYFFGVFVLKE